MTTVTDFVKRNVAELEAISNHLDEAALQKAVELCLPVKRIFFSGMGRSGDMAKALTIRFMHMGYDAYIAGEAATPSIQEGDVLLAITSSAKTKITRSHMEIAIKKGAKVILITSKTEMDGVSDLITIPAKTVVPSEQHAGSLFEQSVLIVGDAIVAAIMEQTHVSEAFMNERHANLQ